MSQTYVLFPDKPQEALLKAARFHGEMILGNSGTTIAKSTGGALSRMPAWMRAAHERVAIGANGRDIARVAATRDRDPDGYFGKVAELIEDAGRVERVPAGPFRAALEKNLERKTDELASHADRPSRENALNATQHRELRMYAEQSGGNMVGARAHEAAADAHFRAAALASTHDSEAPFASHRAREATRAANRCCHEQVRMAGHAAKSAGGDGFSAPAGRGPSHGDSSAFRSQPVRDREFREPRPLDPFGSSGRVTGAGYESGYDYQPDQPAHPMARLFGPPVNGSQMNWNSDSDFGPHDATRPRRGTLNWQRDDGLTGNMSRRHMTEGPVPGYRADQPYPGGAGGSRGRSFEELLEGKAAGYDPGLPLTALVKRYTGSHYPVPLAKSLDLAHALCVAGKLPESTYRSILRLRDFRARAPSAETYKGIRGADDDYGSTVRAIRASAISATDRETLLASIA